MEALDPSPDLRPPALNQYGLGFQKAARDFHLHILKMVSIDPAITIAPFFPLLHMSSTSYLIN